MSGSVLLSSARVLVRVLSYALSIRPQIIDYGTLGPAPFATHVRNGEPFPVMDTLHAGGAGISETVLRLKMTEAVYALLNTDKRYIPTLFDFAGKCRMDMFDLLNKPMTKEIKWQELQFEPDSKLN